MLLRWLRLQGDGGRQGNPWAGQGGSRESGGALWQGLCHHNSTRGQAGLAANISFCWARMSAAASLITRAHVRFPACISSKKSNFQPTGENGA